MLGHLVERTTIMLHFAKRQGFSGTNVGMSRVSRDELDAAPILKGWERLILSARCYGNVECYPEGFFIAVLRNGFLVYGRKGLLKQGVAFRMQRTGGP